MDKVQASESADFESRVTERVVTIGCVGGDSVDVWQYLAENINEFAVAKSIVEHFDANPKGLNDNDIDTLGLYLRARVTIKREQIAYAQAQQAVETARARSRGLRGALKSATGFVADLREALQSRADVILLVSSMAVWACLH